MTTHVDDRPERRSRERRPSSAVYEAGHQLGALLVELDDDDPYVAGHAARRLIRGLLTGARSAAGVRARAHDAAAPVMRAMNALILAATDAGRIHVSESTAVAAAIAAGRDSRERAATIRAIVADADDDGQEFATAFNERHGSHHADIAPVPSTGRLWWQDTADDAEARGRAMARALTDHPDLADLLRRASDALGVYAYHHVNHPDPTNHYPDVGDAIAIMGEIEQVVGARL